MCRTLDLGWSYRDTISFLQHVIGGGRLTVHSDQVVLWTTVGDPLLKQGLHRGTCLDLDLIGKAGTVIVDK
ncbi:hypothetical protein [Gimesia sp.]|uniref:hypothetical protein n=1 Tax=Gimesia sp. TaxID=2024833 RepID=UPI003A953259